MNQFGVAILAAGSSSRMGKPKQLLSYQGLTFLEHTMMTAAAVPGNNLCIVLGANTKKILEAIPAAAEYSVTNESWQEGMGTSIATAVETLSSRSPELKAIIFMTVDQPFVSKKHLMDMLELFAASGKPIVASAYGETVGIPALFAQQFYNDLLLLRSDKGAKEIITRNREQVALLSLPSGEMDIDTPEQYAGLVNIQNEGPALG